MNKLFEYLNPIARLGNKKYSIVFALLFNICLFILSEVFAYGIAKNPNIVGSYIIFLNVASIIYFSFRDGIKAGLLSTGITVIYYFYIIFTREYTGERFIQAVETTIMLGIIYAVLAATIGWLKQRIDTLIEQEKEARYQAEERKVRLQTILDQLPVGVLLANAKDSSLEGNKQIEKIIGRKIEKKLITDITYKSKYAYKNDQQLSAKEWPILRALIKGEMINAEELEFVRDDNKRIFLRVNAAPIKNKNNTIIAAVSTLYDVTAEKELEKRKDDFVNMASHELKTPITSMKLYIDLLLSKVANSSDEKVLKALQSIKNQTEKLQDLVNDLLDVSRIQTGKLQFNKESFTIQDLIRETIELLRQTTKHTIVFSDASSLMVYADKFRIYQVLTNLITNAIKYAPEKTDIIIKVQKKEKKAVISVQDFGIGIGEDQKKKIFDRLYQVTEPKEKTFPGLGMGLYISKEIIKRHKGNIWVESEKGKGSTFYFSLPLAK